MNWLSTEEIERRAEESPEEALNVSIQGWEQKRDALKAGKSIFGHSGTDYCGLCYRYIGNSSFNCPKCFLDDGDTDKSCCPEWRNFSHKESLENIEAMLNRLYLERGKRYGKETKEVCKKEEPPAIRHGDYGLGRNKELNIALLDKFRPTYPGLKLFDKDGILSSLDPQIEIETKLGNIFDDLKMYAEDLAEFEVEASLNNCELHAGRTIEPNNLIYLRTGRLGEGEIMHVNLAKAQEIHQKLGQLIATAKRRQAKKKDC